MNTYRNDDILNVATELINTNGQTTTLEVKNALRNNGFWAEQYMVSRDMDLLTQNGKLTHDDALNGNGYRMYTLPQPDPVTTSVSISDQNHILNKFFGWAIKN